MKWSIAGVLMAMALVGADPGVNAQTSSSAPATAPSAETQALARKVAARDDFVAMIQTAAFAQMNGIQAGLGDLTPEEKAKAQAIGRAKLTESMNRIVDLFAGAYAARFTPEELKSMDSFLETPAGLAYSQRLISLLSALQNMKGFDLKKDTLAETCAQIGKGCPVKAPPKPADTK